MTVDKEGYSLIVEVYMEKLKKMMRYSVETPVKDKDQSNKDFDLLQLAIADTRLQKWSREDLGFIHTDGNVRACDAPPEGFVIFESAEKHDAKYEVIYFAIPENSNWQEVGPFPEGTLKWKKGEWRPLLWDL